MNIYYLLAFVLPSLATNWCPGHGPSTTSRCNNNTFSGMETLLKGAFIETISEIRDGDCFGEDTSSNIFYGVLSDTSVCQNAQDNPSCNYATHLPLSCALIVNMGTYRFGLIMPTTWNGSLLTVGSYSGCSTGGRQGLKQLELDQSLFDGLLIGAPAWNQTHMLPWITKLATINPPGAASSVFNNGTDVVLISRQVREVCDILDGIDTLIQLYQNYTISNSTGRFLGFPAPELGSDADYQTYLGPFVTVAPDGFDWQWEVDFLGYPRGFTFSDHIIEDAEKADPGRATAKPKSTDWNAFNQRGGKVIMYHGLADGLIPTKSTTQYWEDVNAASSGATANFARYYQIPGMHHCGRSDYDDIGYFAPWYIGGIGQQSLATIPQTESVLRNSEFDILTSLMNWVEENSAPTSIVATTWQGTTTTVRRQRPVCPYPQQAVNTNSNNIDKPSSWECH
ncbi:feruloyl esterase b [Paraphaeosphaeria sporulosa]